MTLLIFNAPLWKYIAGHKVFNGLSPRHVCDSVALAGLSGRRPEVVCPSQKQDQSCSLEQIACSFNGGGHRHSRVCLPKYRRQVGKDGAGWEEGDSQGKKKTSAVCLETGGPASHRNQPDSLSVAMKTLLLRLGRRYLMVNHCCLDSLVAFQSILLTLNF